MISIRTILATVLATLALNAFAAVEANQASQAELESVKGIGPSLSGKILDARKTAAFRDWNDMVDRVAGVGPGNAARMSQAGLTVAGQPYQGAAPAPKAERTSQTTRTDKSGSAATATATAGNTRTAKADSARP